jgi:hypothetical protein
MAEPYKIIPVAWKDAEGNTLFVLPTVVGPMPSIKQMRAMFGEPAEEPTEDTPDTETATAAEEEAQA